MTTVSYPRKTALPEFVPFHEPLQATLLRTVTIALGIATVVALRQGWFAPGPSLFRPWAVTLACALWFSFGGHWVEMLFLDVVRHHLPRNRAIQGAARVATWFVGGVLLTVGMRATWAALTGGAVLPVLWPTNWWFGGVSFIIVELIVHAVLLRFRRLPSFYDGRG